MNRSVVAGGIIGAVVLFAAGFGTGFAVKGSETTVGAATLARAAPASTSATAIPTPTTNARGAIVKAFGQDSGLGCAELPCDVEFTISTPVDATECSKNYEPEHGRIIALPISVTTKAGADLSFSSGMWNANNFSAVTASGVTVPRVTSAAAYGCAESKREIPSAMSPASQYEGFVVLDIPLDTESLLFQPAAADGGWEWALN